MSNKVQIIFEALNRSEAAFAAMQADIARMAASTERMAGQAERAGQRTQQAFGGMGGGVTAFLGKLLVAELAVTHIARLLDRLVFDFNSTLETAGLGTAAAFMAGGEYVDQVTGKVLQGQEALQAAQAMSAEMMEQLQAANFATIATLDQLVRAYQETLPVAMAKGFDTRQVKDFTVAMVQAAGAIGLSLDMLGEETRSILTGAINPRTSRIATVLGLRNEDVAQYKGNAQGLFDFLMGKLEAYRAAGIASQQTWAGVWSNTLDILKQVTAKASEPIFETVKQELMDISAELITVNQQTGEIKWDQDFLDGIEEIKQGLIAVVAELYRMGMLTNVMGFSLTTIGRFAFGKRFAKGEAGEANEAYFDELEKGLLDRYEEIERKIQGLANRSIGLNSDGTPKAAAPKTNYRQRPPGAGEGDGEAAAKAMEKRLREYEKVGKATPDDAWHSQWNDRYEVQRRTIEAGIDLENQAAEEGIKAAQGVTDFWLLQEAEKWEVKSRYHDRMNELEEQSFGQMTAFAQQAAANIQDAFAEFLFDPFEGGLMGMLESFEKTLRRMVAQIAANQILSGMFSSMAGSDVGWVSSLGQTFAGAVKKHDGGLVVPRFHLGGLVSDEVPAILQTGERVLSREQSRLIEALANRQGGGNLTVNLIEAPGKGGQVNQSQDGNGQRLDIYVEQIMKQVFNRGSMDSTMSQYGLTRRGF